MLLLKKMLIKYAASKSIKPSASFICTIVVKSMIVVASLTILAIPHTSFSCTILIPFVNLLHSYCMPFGSKEAVNKSRNGAKNQ